MVVMCRIRAYGLKCGLPLILPDPCSCGYDVIEEGVEINLIQVVIKEEEISGFVSEFSQEINTIDSTLQVSPFWSCGVVFRMAPVECRAGWGRLDCIEYRAAW
jgi:hypothetical protein